MSYEIVAVTDQNGRILDPGLLAAAELVHCQLRSHLLGQYVATMTRVLQGGAEMCVAREADRIGGVAVFRVSQNTSQGLHLYVDDLVSDKDQRSRGIGNALLDHLAHIGKQRNCIALVLDSGTQRARAHAFYFREGYAIRAFHFVKPL